MSEACTRRGKAFEVRGSGWVLVVLAAILFVWVGQSMPGVQAEREYAAHLLRYGLLGTYSAEAMRREVEAADATLFAQRATRWACGAYVVGSLLVFGFGAALGRKGKL